MGSVWSETCALPKRAALEEDVTADVAVIGAGMAGLLCAYELSQRGAEVVVLEASRTASGMTQNTTAKITAQHGLIYDRITHQYGAHMAAQYARANTAAIERYRSIAKQRGIECDLQTCSAFVYSLNDQEPIAREAEAARKAGIDAYVTQDTELPFEVAAALRFGSQAQFHPLKFLQGIVNELEIYENTMVRSIDGQAVTTDRGTVSAKKIIVATHYPFINTPGYYFVKMYQQRSYVLGLTNANPVENMYIGADEDAAYSFRSYGDLLLFGGEAHHTGDNREGGCYERLYTAAREYYPEAAAKYRWSAQDCMTPDGIPYIGLYSHSLPELYVATGFNKWGMTSSMVASQILADMAQGKENENAAVFSPQRFSVTGSAAALAANAASAVAGLSKTAFSVPTTLAEDLVVGHGGIVELDGHKVGVYKDDSGEVFAVSTICTHLGCQLAWNPDEKTWDCPCHGSRFDYRGRLISGPAMEDLKRW